MLLSIVWLLCIYNVNNLQTYSFHLRLDEAPATNPVAPWVPSLYLPPPTCCQCVWCVFVWRCFDCRRLCVWAVLGVRWACPVQSWWRAKCSPRAGCAFHSAQPPWTPSRQTAAGGKPLPFSLFFLSCVHTEWRHHHPTSAFTSHRHIFQSSLLSSFLILTTLSTFPLLSCCYSDRIFVKPHLKIKKTMDRTIDCWVWHSWRQWR